MRLSIRPRYLFSRCSALLSVARPYIENSISPNGNSVGSEEVRRPWAGASMSPVMASRKGVWVAVVGAVAVPWDREHAKSTMNCGCDPRGEPRPPALGPDHAPAQPGDETLHRLARPCPLQARNTRRDRPATPTRDSGPKRSIGVCRMPHSGVSETAIHACPTARSQTGQTTGSFSVRRMERRRDRSRAGQMPLLQGMRASERALCVLAPQD